MTMFEQKDVFFEMQEKYITKSGSFLSKNGVNFILKWKKKRENNTWLLLW